MGDLDALKLAVHHLGHPGRLLIGDADDHAGTVDLGRPGQGLHPLGVEGIVLVVDAQHVDAILGGDLRRSHVRLAQHHAQEQSAPVQLLSDGIFHAHACSPSPPKHSRSRARMSCIMASKRQRIICTSEPTVITVAPRACIRSAASGV